MAPVTGTPRLKRGLVVTVVLVVLGLAVGVAAATGLIPRVTEWLGHSPDQAGADNPRKPPSHELVRDAKKRPVDPPTLRLSEEAAQSLGIRPETIVKVEPAEKPRPLPPLEGTLAWENDALYAVRPRFAGEVAEIMPAKKTPLELRFELSRPGTNPSKSPDLKRPLTFGDRVKKGDVLAIVWSKDLGEKKAALIDALIDLRRDQQQLATRAKLFEQGAISLTSYREQERTVQKEINLVNAAERTLRIWKLTDDEIEAIKDEATKIEKTKRDPKKEQEWAKVEVKAPHDGVIVEKNTNLGDWVDPVNSPPMFRIADLSTLAFWVHPLEEYLPELQKVIDRGDPAQIRCKLRLHADPSRRELEGPLLRIAPSVDPNQHTLLVMGRIPNPDHRFLVGQFLTATVYIRPGPDLVEIPTTALNEDAGQSLVFVQRDPNKLEFTVRRVAVTDRFKDRVLVRSKIDPAAEVQPPPVPGLRGPWPVQPLRKDEHIVTQGVPMLTMALRDSLAREALSAQEKK
jgi:cobalt-zinc-cadmium efflux system membrane fusion protein